MTLEETNNCEIIDELIRQGRSFAMYRNPGEEEPHFLMQTCGEVHLIRKMEDLNGRDRLCHRPFPGHSAMSYHIDPAGLS